MAGEITEKATGERLARIETALEGIRKDQDELRAWLAAVLSEMRNATSSVQTQANARDLFCAAKSSMVTAFDEKVREQQKRLETVEKLMPALRVVMWVGALIGASLLALIWSLITGEVTLVFAGI